MHPPNYKHVYILTHYQPYRGISAHTYHHIVTRARQSSIRIRLGILWVRGHRSRGGSHIDSTLPDSQMGVSASENSPIGTFRYRDVTVVRHVVTWGRTRPQRVASSGATVKCWSHHQNHQGRGAVCSKGQNISGWNKPGICNVCSPFPPAANSPAYWPLEVTFDSV